MNILPVARARGATALAFGLVYVLLLGIYWPGLHGAFFFDDGPSIMLPAGVRLDALSWDSLRQAWMSGGAGPSGRPIAQLSFALNYYFSGFSPMAFKSTNLAIHATCGLLVFGLAQNLLKVAYPFASRERTLAASGIVTILWMFHPIQLLPVLHVVQRMTSLSALFLLGAIWLHTVGRGRGDIKGAVQLILAWIVLWPLSFLSKETGLLFPGFVLAWELIIRRSTSGQTDTFARILTFISAVGGLAVTTYLVSSKAQWLWAGYELRPFSMGERVLTEVRVLWLYLGLICFPKLSSFGLYHDDIEISTDWLMPWTTLPAGFGLFLLVLLAWHLRKRAPLVAFGIVWFFIGHAMESTVLPLEIAHEHRNYLPLLGVLLAVAGAVMTNRKSNEVLSARVKHGLSAVGFLLLVAVPAITGLRAYQFGDEIRRTQMAAQDHPESSLAQYDAGSILAGLSGLTTPDSPLYARAQKHFVLANELNPDFKMGALGLIYLSCKTGELPQPAAVAELVRRLRDTPFAPGDRSVVYSLKEMALNDTTCLTRQDMNDLFAAALANPSVSPSVRAMLLSWQADYFWLGVHDLGAAREALTQSLALNPSNLSNRLKWAQLILLSGERERARQLLLALKDQHFSAQERDTLDELLATVNMPKP